MKTAISTFFTALIALCVVNPLIAQERTVNGVVVSGSNEPIEGIVISAGSESTVTDAGGRFTIQVAEGIETLQLQAGGSTRVIPIDELDSLIVLADVPVYRGSVTVSAIRGPRAAPIAETTIGDDELERLDRGQDVPLLLEKTPSVVSWADAGSGGSGYSYFSIRGIGTTRINTTIDGVPLNDPAEHAVYFANFADLSSNVDSVQIQRGVGSSTLGSPVLGGSVNFASASPNDDQGLSGYLGVGSYDHRRGSVAWNTGLLDQSWRLYARASVNESDGYRDNSGVEQHSFWISADHQTPSNVTRIFGFSGQEASELSYLATDEATLRENPTFNPLTERDRDDFGQDLLKIESTWFLSDTRSVAATAYYNGADGWFDVDIVSDVLRYAIDGHQVGLIGVMSGYGEELSWDAGIHVTDFTRDHTLEIADVRQYINTGEKNEVSAFFKTSWRAGDLTLFGDAQARYARFSYEGDVDLGSVDWTFFNPKIGARYALGSGSSLYGSIGRSEREPARADMLLGEDNATINHDLEAVLPEELTDFEIGWDYSNAGLATNVNVYAMEFRNEIALTGELSDIGLPTRINVDRSYRRGIELDIAWSAMESLVFAFNTTLSRNQIEEWTQFYDIYSDDFDYLGSRPIVHRNVEPLLTPETIVNAGVSWRPIRGVFAAMDARWISESQLDNTGNENLRTPSYSVVDLRGSVELGRWLGARAPVLQWAVRNLLDEDELWPSGYSYPYLVRGSSGAETIDGTSYFYPLSGRSASLTLEWRM